MARRKETSIKPFKRRFIISGQGEPPEPPELRGERMRKLRAASCKAWVDLDKATTVADLKAFWVARKTDLHNTVIQVEFPKFIEHTWAILRKLADETDLDIPPEPSTGHHPTFVEAYYNGKQIPVDKLLLRNTVDLIVDWCHNAEPNNKTVPPMDSVPRFDPKRGILYLNDRSFNLEANEDDVLKVLVREQCANLGKLRESGCNSPQKVLRRLIEKYPELENYIFLPGKKGGGGYSTKIMAVD